MRKLPVAYFFIDGPIRTLLDQYQVGQLLTTCAGIVDVAILPISSLLLKERTFLEAWGLVQSMPTRLTASMDMP